MNLYKQLNIEYLNKEWYNIPRNCRILKCPHIDPTFECNMSCKLIHRYIYKSIPPNKLYNILKLYCPNFSHLQITNKIIQ